MYVISDAKLILRERENREEFAYEYDNMSRQLELLRNANQRLQDTNDGLRNIVDIREEWNAQT